MVQFESEWRGFLAADSREVLAFADFVGCANGNCWTTFLAFDLSLDVEVGFDPLAPRTSTARDTCCSF
jgi:hypothetical protein